MRKAKTGEKESRRISEKCGSIFLDSVRSFMQPEAAISPPQEPITYAVSVMGYTYKVIRQTFLMVG
jgi:hypothetical protein